MILLPFYLIFLSLGFSRFGPGDGLQAPLPRGVGHDWRHVYADLQGAARPLPAGNCHRLPPVPPRAFPLPRPAPEAGVPGGGGNAQVNHGPLWPSYLVRYRKGHAVFNTASQLKGTVQSSKAVYR